MHCAQKYILKTFAILVEILPGYVSLYFQHVTSFGTLSLFKIDMFVLTVSAVSGCSKIIGASSLKYIQNWLINLNPILQLTWLKRLK